MENNEQTYEVKETTVEKTVETPVDQVRMEHQPITFREWMLNLFLVMIPIVGLVFLFIWAFSEDTKPCKANWAKATLLWMAIVIALYVIFFAIIMAIIGGSFGELLRQ